MPTDPDQLVAGPVGSAHPFPLWVKDSTGLRLAPLDAPRPETAGDAPSVPAPRDAADEAVYLRAEARLPTAGARAGEARLVLVVSATTASAEVRGRLQVRFDDAVPGGTYTVTHPYGTVVDTADERGRLRVAAELPAPGPFLRWARGGPATPAGRIGDGVTPHPVTGSPFGTNAFGLEGPGVAGGSGRSARVRTDLFVLDGRVARVVGIAVPRAVYARGPDGEVTVDVFAVGEPGQSVEVRAPAVPPTRARGRAGSYVARLRTTGPPPATVSAVNTTDSPPTTATVPLLDAVTVSAATYDLAAGVLTVAAASADEAAPPELTVDGLGPLVDGRGSFTLDAPPPEVVVRSEAGGVARCTVSLVGPALPPLHGTPVARPVPR